MLVFFSRGDCIFISGIYGILCVFLEENCSCDCHIYVFFIEIKHISSTSSTRATIPVYGDDLHLFFRSERNCNVRKNTCFYLSSILKNFTQIQSLGSFLKCSMELKTGYPHTNLSYLLIWHYNWYDIIVRTLNPLHNGGVMYMNHIYDALLSMELIWKNIKFKTSN